MSKETKEEIQSGNWVSMKFIVIPSILGICFILPGYFAWPWFIPAILFLVMGGYFLIARRLFSPSGGKLQEKILNRLMSEIRWAGGGKVLDIGCGSGALAITLARTYRDADIVGVDFWGKGWGYSKDLCERKAKSTGVSGRIKFLQGSAADIPFDDDSFDLVVSNMVFHEVKDVKDKTICLAEALRVLKPGGIFVLQDLFLLKPFFGTPETLIKTLRNLGASEADLIRTCDEPFIPPVLKLPFMLGTAALVKGKK